MPETKVGPGGSAGAEAGLDRPTVVLSNGLHVKLAVRVDSSESDLAICSTDWEGNRGRLSEAVFRSAGIDYDRLKKEFTPPFRLFENEGSKGTKVLAVTTLGGSPAKRSWSMLFRNLRDGLEDTLRGRTFSRIWCAFFTTTTISRPSTSRPAWTLPLSRVAGGTDRPTSRPCLPP